jgi:hypothetical protein
MKRIFFISLIFIIQFNTMAAVVLPGTDYYRNLVLSVRTQAKMVVPLPTNQNYEIKYQLHFAKPVYEVPIISDTNLSSDPQRPIIIRSFFDRILLSDESFIEFGNSRVPLTCIFVDGQDNRASGMNSPTLPQFVLKVYLVGNDFSCQGPIRPGWPYSGGRRDNWDTYIYFEIKDPTIMLPMDIKLRYRWNEYNAILVDEGNL